MVRNIWRRGGDEVLFYRTALNEENLGNMVWEVWCLTRDTAHSNTISWLLRGFSPPIELSFQLYEIVTWLVILYSCHSLNDDAIQYGKKRRRRNLWKISTHCAGRDQTQGNLWSIYTQLLHFFINICKCPIVIFDPGNKLFSIAFLSLVFKWEWCIAWRHMRSFWIFSWRQKAVHWELSPVLVY